MITGSFLAHTRRLPARRRHGAVREFGEFLTCKLSAAQDDAVHFPPSMALRLSTYGAALGPGR